MIAGQIAFYVLAATAIGSAIGVVAFRNAVYSALSLIVTLFSLAFFFLMLNAIFLAAIQVLIYAGGIMVLFLFVVNTLSPDPVAIPSKDRMVWQSVTAVGIGAILLVAGGIILLGQSGVHTDVDAVMKGTSDIFTAITTQGGDTEAFGIALFHGFLFPFEVTSVILIAAILGAVVLGRRAVGRGAEE